jgi:membrane carboxypeptidase/penicillin-binding protein
MNGQTIYRYPDEQNSTAVDPAERASFYQLKTILQGVVARGTARAIASLSPYVAGKTGTTEDVIDGWFVGFTNDVTVAVWVGYDNADRKRRSLGSSETGASVALPIFEPIIEAIWAREIAPTGQASNDEHGGAKLKEAQASKRTSARRTQQAARQLQGREYYDSWQPFGRGQESNYRW